MKDEYYLYWIHRPCQTDIKTVGYVGITCCPEKRFISHRSDATCGSDFSVHRAIRKYKDIMYDVICVGNVNYITNLEYLLRPSFRIGWNIAVGGDKPTIGEVRPRDLVIQMATECTSVSKFNVVKMMIDHYIRGMSYSQVAKKHGTSAAIAFHHVYGNAVVYPELNSIRDRLKRYVHTQLLSEDIYKDIMSLRESGVSHIKIAKKFGMTEYRVLKICYGKENGTEKFDSYRIYEKRTAVITYNGESNTIVEWAKIFNIKYSTLLNRVKSGWDVNTALTKPVGISHKNKLNIVDAQGGLNGG